MRSKTWKSCLGVLCLMAAGTANAAKISFSDKGFIDIGALVQAQYQIVENGAPSGGNPSNNFALGRARIVLAGQFNDNIAFFVDTDVSYGAISTAIGNTPPGAGVSNTPTGGVATAWNNNIYLLDALATYKVSKELLLDAGLMLLPYSHNELTSGAKYASATRFVATFAPNSQRALRDVGVELRGLLLSDRLYYRLGVWNGVNGVKNTAVAPAPSNGLNPGDAPLFAGMIRFNIAGKEDGYAFCQVCFASTPIINIGVSGLTQINAIRPVVYTGPGTSTQLGMTQWTSFVADAFADVPFGSDLELSAEFQFANYWAGTNTTQSGYEMQGLLAFRFGVFGIFGQIDYFNSQTQYVGRGNLVGDRTIYAGGLNLYLYQNVYKITAEFTYATREAGGTTVDGTAIPPNFWSGILQFQAAF
ncbi:MAG: porin [Myxococcaceae bacterium]